MNIVGVMFLLVIYISILRNAYFAWFRPASYFKVVEKDREFIAKYIPFILNLWTVKPITSNRKIDLFWARLGSFFMVIVSALVIFTIILK